MLFELLRKNRTVRRYERSRRVEEADIKEMLECARLTASAANLQRIRYASLTGKSADAAFPFVTLGGLLPPDKKTTEKTSPTAYVVMASEEKDFDPNLMIDVGISAEAITLAAAEKGIGSCMIRNFNKEYFVFSADEKMYYPILVIALGYADEGTCVVDAKEGESLKYNKMDDNVNYVPKLVLQDLWKKKN